MAKKGKTSQTKKRKSKKNSKGQKIKIDKQAVNFDRLPPQNIEAEQSVLGSLMLDKNAIIKVSDIIYPECFYRTAHQIIFETMLELFEGNEPIDLLSISNKLEEKNKLKDIGGTSYLTDLVNTVPSAANILHYAKIVQKKKIHRDLIDAAYDITHLGYQEVENVENLLDEAEKRIFSISQKSIKQYFTPIKPALEEAFERIDALHKGNKKSLRGISTGFIDLDNILTGLQKSNLVILASRPSLGKTTLSLDLARHIAVNEKVPVGIFSLEMSSSEIVDRLICSQARVGLWKLRAGQLSSSGENNDFSKIQNAIGTLSETPIFIDDTPGASVMELRTKARRLQAEHGLGIVVVDYLQLMEEPRIRTENLVQKITEISRGLKALARELDIPVLALSQLSRAVEQRSPQIPRLSDLRESGSLEQDADVVLFIHREDLYKKDTERKNIAEIHIAKHRNGPRGIVDLFFNENFVCFQNLDKRYEK